MGLRLSSQCWVALTPVGPGSKYFPSKICDWGDIDVMPNRKLMGPVCQSSRAHKVEFRPRPLFLAVSAWTNRVFEKIGGYLSHLVTPSHRYTFLQVVAGGVPSLELSPPRNDDKQQCERPVPHPPLHRRLPIYAVHLHHRLSGRILLVRLGTSAPDECSSGPMGSDIGRDLVLLLHLPSVYAPAEPQSCAPYTPYFGGKMGSLQPMPGKCSVHGGVPAMVVPRS